MPEIIILVAHDKHRAIGNKGTIPWHIPEDLKRFKELTMGHTIIMGRKTWDSLPKKPLPGRQNIVVSRGFVEIPSSYSIPTGSIEVADSVDEAIQLAKSNQIFIIGGGQIYKTVLERCIVDRVIYTLVEGEYEGDVFFPQLLGQWETTMLESAKGYSIWEARHILPG
jgi:dihydrofolate reductase